MKTEDIKNRILQKYVGCTVDVIDLTGTEDHYKVSIECKNFEGMSRVEAHRQIMDLFQKELTSGEIHAFTISTSIPKTQGVTP